jgi:hypothetical protein
VVIIIAAFIEAQTSIFLATAGANGPIVAPPPGGITGAPLLLRSWYHFAGLDVSVKETSVCIVDDTGRIVGEVKVPSEPKALLKVLTNPAYRFKRIGLEAEPLSQW